MDTTLTDDDRIRLAEQASTISILSIVLCLMGSCGCVTVFLALPLSAWGFSIARRALDTPTPSPTLTAWGRSAFGFNLVALIYSALFTILVGSYVLLYVFMIAFVVALEAL